MVVTGGAYIGALCFLDLWGRRSRCRFVGLFADTVRKKNTSAIFKYPKQALTGTDISQRQHSHLMPRGGG